MDLAQKVLLPPEGLSLQWTRVQRIGAGLQNMGNTCFLNSALQCLTHTPPLANYLLTRQHSRKCVETEFCMMCTMENHVIAVFESSGDVVRPIEIVSKLSSIADHFMCGRQEDAHEFLQHTLNAMHRSCVSNTLEGMISNTSVIDRLFGGYLRSRVECSACKEVSDTYEPFQDLTLDIERASSVSKALKRFVKPEKLGGENSYKCSKCLKMVSAKKSLRIHRSPDVLTLSLKRFGYFSTRKISKDVKFREFLDLGRFMSEAGGEPQIYSLYGVMVHAGARCNSGHYLCFIKASDGQWYRMNDSSVCVSDIDTVLKQEAYLLFYIRSTDRSAEADCSHQTGTCGQLVRPHTSPAVPQYHSGLMDLQLEPDFSKTSPHLHGDGFMDEDSWDSHFLSMLQSYGDEKSSGSPLPSALAAPDTQEQSLPDTSDMTSAGDCGDVRFCGFMDLQLEPNTTETSLHLRGDGFMEERVCRDRSPLRERCCDALPCRLVYRDHYEPCKPHLC
ncbi:ubiquitin carboxyl-terminal hydrolase 17-like protein 6 [Menidia menidia]